MYESINHIIVGFPFGMMVADSHKSAFDERMTGFCVFGVIHVRILDFAFLFRIFGREIEWNIARKLRMVNSTAPAIQLKSCFIMLSVCARLTFNCQRSTRFSMPPHEGDERVTIPFFPMRQALR